MNFQKSWDIDFQKFLDCDIFFEKFFFKNFNYVLILFLNDRFCVVDIVDIVDIVDFVDFLSPELTFIFLYSKYIILGIIGERERLL